MKVYILKPLLTTKRPKLINNLYPQKFLWIIIYFGLTKEFNGFVISPTQGAFIYVKKKFRRIQITPIAKGVLLNGDAKYVIVYQLVIVETSGDVYM